MRAARLEAIWKVDVMERVDPEVVEISRSEFECLINAVCYAH
jgi:hypothetical protein